MQHSWITSLLAPLALTLSMTAGAVSHDQANGMTGLSGAPAEQEQTSVRLDLNTADAATLQRELEGVGKAKAEAIINYRSMNGNFASVDELLEVQGIGKSILERNRSKLMVK